MPETLLKKRKSQEKERADKAEQRETKKKVRLLCFQISTAVMIPTQTTRLASGQCCRIVNHLSGLNIQRHDNLVIRSSRDSC